MIRAQSSQVQSSQHVVNFWFANNTRPKWFHGGEAFDEELRERFGDLERKAAEGALDDWAETPQGALALVLLLDQMPRNLHRGTPAAFASDPKALAVAREAIARGFDREMTQPERLFLYLPFEHSEDLADQKRSVELMAALDEDPGWLDYAEQHLVIIERFGRFPHRNAILGRESSEEEAAFLKQPGSSF